MKKKVRYWLIPMGNIWNLPVGWPEKWMYLLLIWINWPMTWLPVICTFNKDKRRNTIKIQVVIMDLIFLLSGKNFLYAIKNNNVLYSAQIEIRISLIITHIFLSNTTFFLINPFSYFCSKAFFLHLLRKFHILLYFLHTLN